MRNAKNYTIIVTKALANAPHYGSVHLLCPLGLAKEMEVNTVKCSQ